MSAPAAARADVLERVRVAGPNLVLVAFGAPKQELWISESPPRPFDPAVLLGVGASIDFIAGAAKRAPAWIATTGSSGSIAWCKSPAAVVEALPPPGPEVRPSSCCASLSGGEARRANEAVPRTPPTCRRQNVTVPPEDEDERKGQEPRHPRELAVPGPRAYATHATRPASRRARSSRPSEKQRPVGERARDLQRKERSAAEPPHDPYAVPCGSDRADRRGDLIRLRVSAA